MRIVTSSRNPFQVRFTSNAYDFPSVSFPLPRFVKGRGPKRVKYIRSPRRTRYNPVTPYWEFNHASERPAANIEFECKVYPSQETSLPHIVAHVMGVMGTRNRYSKALIRVAQQIRSGHEVTMHVHEKLHKSIVRFIAELVLNLSDEQEPKDYQAPAQLPRKSHIVAPFAEEMEDDAEVVYFQVRAPRYWTERVYSWDFDRETVLRRDWERMGIDERNVEEMIDAARQNDPDELAAPAAMQTATLLPAPFDKGGEWRDGILAGFHIITPDEVLPLHEVHDWQPTGMAPEEMALLGYSPETVAEYLEALADFRERYELLTASPTKLAVMTKGMSPTQRRAIENRLHLDATFEKAYESLGYEFEDADETDFADEQDAEYAHPLLEREQIGHVKPLTITVGKHTRIVSAEEQYKQAGIRDFDKRTYQVVKETREQAGRPEVTTPYQRTAHIAAAKVYVGAKWRASEKEVWKQSPLWHATAQNRSPIHYKRWLWKQLRADTAAKRELFRLAAEVKAGKSLTLVAWPHKDERDRAKAAKAEGGRYIPQPPAYATVIADAIQWIVSGAKEAQKPQRFAKPEPVAKPVHATVSRLERLRARVKTVVAIDRTAQAVVTAEWNRELVSAALAAERNLELVSAALAAQ